MKKLFFGFLLSLLIISIAIAQHLTCDPQPASMVTKYKIRLNGEVIPANIENAGEGLVRIYYDVAPLAPGNYIVAAAAGDDYGMWSEWSTPIFEFTIDDSLALPNAPQGLELITAITEPGIISRDNWSIVSVSSYEKGTPAENAIDGNIETFWHSNWTAIPPVTAPHEIIINLGKEYKVCGFHYLARQDSNWNGTIKDYIFEVSIDGDVWIEVKTGTLIRTRDEQFVEFTTHSARYVKFIAKSEINNEKWANIAEFNIVGY